MQIELIGCTSAGKSTLISGIVQACNAQQLDVWVDGEFILKQFGLNGIKSHLLRTILIDLAALLACLVTVRRNRAFYGFTLKVLRPLSMTLLEKFYIFRNVLRKLGKYEIMRFYSTEEEIILVDEGVLQVAHNLFVHVSGQVETKALMTFASLAPPPDVIVYLKQPTSLLIERTMKRGHKRIADPSHQNVDRFIKRAVATFDKLVQHPTIAHKVVVIEGGQAVSQPAKHVREPRFNRILQLMQQSISRMKSPADMNPSTENAFAESRDVSPVAQPVQPNGG